MKFIRMMLIASILLVACCLAMLAMKFPGVVVFFVVLLCIGVARKGYRRLTAHGTARWSDGDDLRRAGMLDADSGLILRRITDCRPKLETALNGLYDRRVG